MQPEDMNRWSRGARFEKFTEAARRTLVYAQEEARGLGHHYIGTEHLLLGLVREDQTVAGAAFKDLGFTIEVGRRAVAAILPAQTDVPPNMVAGLTPRARKTIELAIKEARDQGDHFIGTEHIVFGILSDGEGIANGILHSVGLDSSRIRAQVLAVRAAKHASAEGNVERVVSSNEPSARANVLSFRLTDPQLAVVDTLIEAGVCGTRSEAAAWLVAAGIAAKREFFLQVESTVAQIRALRAQTQALAQQEFNEPQTGDLPPA